MSEARDSGQLQVDLETLSRRLDDLQKSITNVNGIALSTEETLAGVDAQLRAVEHLVSAHLAVYSESSLGHLARMKGAVGRIPSDSAYDEVREEFCRIIGDIERWFDPEQRAPSRS